MENRLKDQKQGNPLEIVGVIQARVDATKLG